MSGDPRLFISCADPASTCENEAAFSGAAGVCNRSSTLCTCPEGYSGIDDFYTSNDCHINEDFKLAWHTISLVLNILALLVACAATLRLLVRWGVLKWPETNAVGVSGSKGSDPPPRPASGQNQLLTGRDDVQETVPPSDTNLHAANNHIVGSDSKHVAGERERTDHERQQRPEEQEASGKEDTRVRRRSFDSTDAAGKVHFQTVSPSPAAPWGHSQEGDTSGNPGDVTPNTAIPSPRPTPGEPHLNVASETNSGLVSGEILRVLVSGRGGAQQATPDANEPLSSVSERRVRDGSNRDGSNRGEFASPQTTITTATATTRSPAYTDSQIVVGSGGVQGAGRRVCDGGEEVASDDEEDEASYYYGPAMGASRRHGMIRSSLDRASLATPIAGGGFPRPSSSSTTFMENDLGGLVSRTVGASSFEGSEVLGGGGSQKYLPVTPEMFTDSRNQSSNVRDARLMNLDPEVPAPASSREVESTPRKEGGESAASKPSGAPDAVTPSATPMGPNSVSANNAGRAFESEKLEATEMNMLAFADASEMTSHADTAAHSLAAHTSSTGGTLSPRAVKSPLLPQLRLQGAYDPTTTGANDAATVAAATTPYPKSTATVNSTDFRRTPRSPSTGKAGARPFLWFCPRIHLEALHDPKANVRTASYFAEIVDAKRRRRTAFMMICFIGYSISTIITIGYFMADVRPPYNFESQTGFLLWNFNCSIVLLALSLWTLAYSWFSSLPSLGMYARMFPQVSDNVLVRNPRIIRAVIAVNLLSAMSASFVFLFLLPLVLTPYEMVEWTFSTGICIVAAILANFGLIMSIVCVLLRRMFQTFLETTNNEDFLQQSAPAPSGSKSRASIPGFASSGSLCCPSPAASACKQGSSSGAPSRSGMKKFASASTTITRVMITVVVVLPPLVGFMLVLAFLPGAKKFLFFFLMVLYDFGAIWVMFASHLVVFKMRTSARKPSAQAPSTKSGGAMFASFGSFQQVF